MFLFFTESSLICIGRTERACYKRERTLPLEGSVILVVRPFSLSFYWRLLWSTFTVEQGVIWRKIQRESEEDSAVEGYVRKMPPFMETYHNAAFQMKKIRRASSIFCTLAICAGFIALGMPLSLWRDRLLLSAAARCCTKTSRQLATLIVRTLKAWWC